MLKDSLLSILDTGVIYGRMEIRNFGGALSGKPMRKLKQEDRIFENILQGITDSVLVLSKDFKILWANQAFQNQTGYKIEEIIGNYCYKITHRQEVPCQPPHDVCPVIEAEKINSTATTTHIHFDTGGNKIFVQASAYPIKDEKGQITQFVCMYKDITDLKRTEEMLRVTLSDSKLLAHNLAERVKELNCLYSISTFTDKPELTLEELIQRIVNIIPPAWQYPIVTCARITMEGHEFKTENFKETVWKQATDLLVYGNRIGTVEVFYLEEKPDYDEGPFLKEERRLLNAIAERVGRIIERKRAEEALKRAIEKSQQRQTELLAMLEGTRAVLKYHDFESAARSIFNSCKKLIGATSGYIALLSKDRAENEVVFLEPGGLPCAVDPTLPMPIRGLRAEVYRNIKTVYDNDFPRSEWMEFMPEGHVKLSNVLFAPMVIEEKAVGLLGIANKPGGFTDNDARMASAFSELVAIALVQKRFEEALRRARDELEIRVKERTTELLNEIKERKKAESHINATNALLKFFVQTSSRKEYLEKVIELIQNWSQCRSVGIRVLDKEGNIPYESYRGFSKEFRKSENFISIKKDMCACIRVITGRLELQDSSVMTPTGSFFSNNLYKFIKGLSKDEKARFRGVCVDAGYKSVAILPIRYRDKILGAIHLADERESIVPLKTVEFIESIAPLVGEAIFRFNVEEELKRSEKSLTEAQKVARLGNWDWNIQTNQLYWSDEIYNIFGLSSQQFGATYEAFLDSVHPDDRESVKKAVNEALYNHKPYRIDHRIVLPDGAIRIVQERGEVTFDNTSKPIRMIGIVQDITDIKRAEEELKKSYEQLRNLSSHLQSVREEERANVAREIHDELGQALTALKIDLSMLTTKLYPDHKPLVEKAGSMTERIDETIQTVKKICTELRPTILDHFGLSAAIEWQTKDFERRYGIICNVSLEPKETILDQDTSTAVFRIFQEALTNVARHANATEVKVGLKEQNGLLILKVKDNGKGITEKQISKSNSFGLLGMKERVYFRGGKIDIKGVRNKGTTITVSVPIKEERKG